MTLLERDLPPVIDDAKRLQTAWTLVFDSIDSIAAVHDCLKRVGRPGAAELAAAIVPLSHELAELLDKIETLQALPHPASLSIAEDRP